MRDRCRQFAQGADTRHVLELATRVTERVLRLFLLRDVAVGFHGGDATPAFVALHGPAAGNPYFTTVASRVNELALPAAGVVELLSGAGRQWILCLEQSVGFLPQRLLS